MAQLLGARLDGKDERSRNFRAPLAEDIRTVMHKHYGPVLNQWVGSCTGHESTQRLNCWPLHTAREQYYNDSVAMRIYSRATQIDPWAGEYPPDDTGSSVLAAAKAAKEFGYISGYRWCFGYDQMLAGLMQNPVGIGTNWYDNMFHPTRVGFLDVSGSLAGGHAYLVTGYSKVYKYFTILNSWSIAWGNKGRARIKADDMRRLIEDDGEAVVYLP